MEKENEGKNNIQHNNQTIKTIITIMLTIILFICIVYIITQLNKSNKNEEMYRKLNQTTSIEKEKTNDDNTLEEEQQEEKNENVEKTKALQKENPDVKGWIQIENTNINYPMLQTTNNDYYMTHDYKKEKNDYGSIVINTNSNINGENANVILYGHKMMRDDQMFSDLHKYQNKQFYEEHPIVKIATDEGEEQYEIIYVFKSRIFYQDETNVFRYYRYFSFENESQFNEYIENCKKLQLYDIGKTAQYGEKLLTMITCEYSQENGRMVVVAKRIT